MNEICPSCGEFFGQLDAESGWCRSCTSAHQWEQRRTPPPVPVVWKNCKHCGRRFAFQTTNHNVKLWGTCPECIHIVRSRARNGLPPLVASGRCLRCQRAFEFTHGAAPRMFCPSPSCQAWFRRQRASKAGKASGERRRLIKITRPGGIGESVAHGPDGRFTSKEPHELRRTE